MNGADDSRYGQQFFYEFFEELDVSLVTSHSM